ncbi:MAG: RT0821/Lpp0805 family surface protein [Desulfobacterales bacterium]|nr:RT0821/Lpp0805 family surface protein [Desulfobacterales bacterium]
MSKKNLASNSSKISAIAIIFNICAGSMFISVQSAAKTSSGVPLPTYQLGVTFVYSDGKSETVEAVRDNLVIWRDNRNRVTTGSRDFTLRRQQWETETRQGTRQHRPRNDFGQTTSASLWPLTVGNKAHYVETGRWQKKKGEWQTYTYPWQSEVIGRERIRTLAGEFDTWKIVANRYSGGKVYGRPPRLREIRTWYYAPQVGHYVRYERDFLGRKPNRSIDLVSVRPPVEHLNAKLRSVIADNFQMALEKKHSGQKLQWRMTQQSASGMTQPINTFRGAGKRDCRNYVQEVEIERDNHIYYGMACRNPNGRWEIPDL